MSQAQKAHAMTKTMLDEFLGEGADMGVTITNLEEMLAHNELRGGMLSDVALFNARRALVSLNNLVNTMEVFVV